jgi:hypothetical protein
VGKNIRICAEGIAIHICRAGGKGKREWFLQKKVELMDRGFSAIRLPIPLRAGLLF